jgi:HEAT repeat protein
LNISALSDFGDENLREQLIRRFLLRDQVASVNVQSSQAIALTLLQSVPRRI